MQHTPTPESNRGFMYHFSAIHWHAGRVNSSGLARRDVTENSRHYNHCSRLAQVDATGILCVSSRRLAPHPPETGSNPEQSFRVGVVNVCKPQRVWTPYLHTVSTQHAVGTPTIQKTCDWPPR
jgi:hypothetical protein